VNITNLLIVSYLWLHVFLKANRILLCTTLGWRKFRHCTSIFTARQHSLLCRALY